MTENKMNSEDIGLKEDVRAKFDSVNHPQHYCDSGMECIDEMIKVFGVKAVMDFCLLNVWKYRKRAVFKGGKEDMEKSNWYLNKYLELKR